MPLGAQPISGKPNVITALQQQSDALKYVHDETIGRVNAGQSVDEIAATLRVPSTNSD